MAMNNTEDGLPTSYDTLPPALDNNVMAIDIPPMATQNNPDEDWDENFAASPSDLDSIMTDADTKK